MKLLLDTHIWLWSLVDRTRLSPRVVQELEDPSNELWLSAISTWEVGVLWQKKRLVLDQDVVSWIAGKLRAVPLREAPITHEVSLETARIQLPHNDPADRLLIATARVFDLTLVTADELLLRTSDVAILPNR